MSHRAQTTADEFSRWLDGHNIVRAARLSGIGRSTLYEWMDGGHPVPAWALAPLYGAVPSISGLAHTIGLPDLSLELMPTSERPHTGLADQGLRLGKTAGDVAGELGVALADGVVSDDEREKIEHRLDALRIEMARLQALLASPRVSRR